MPEPELSPQEEQVRRLLAEARHDEPMPDDVADRLDRVLADLRSPGSPPGAADLAAARRRRTRGVLVLAAAAAVVVGVGISRVDLSGSSDDSASGGSADAGASRAEDRAEVPQDASGDLSAQSLDRLLDAGAAAGPPRFRSGSSFDRQIQRYAERQRLSKDLADGLGAPNLVEGYSAAVDVCTDPAWGKGVRVPARYDHERAVLVVRPVREGERVVDLYLCGGDEPVRSTTVRVD